MLPGGIERKCEKHLGPDKWPIPQAERLEQIPSNFVVKYHHADINILGIVHSFFEMDDKNYSFIPETSAVSALFLHVLISGVFCIHLLFKDLMERLHLIFLFRVLYPKHLLHMLPWK